MMDLSIESNELLRQLIDRLPELEWKINGLGSYFSSKNVPRGLFRSATQLSGAACIAEIKADIYALGQQKNKRSAFYLAERIRQKISVLVVLCHIVGRENKLQEKVCFGVTMLSSRQQWIRELQAEIDTLVDQQQAMTKTLEHRKHHNVSDGVLRLKAELGEVERRLTLARETLNRTVS